MGNHTFYVGNEKIVVPSFTPESSIKLIEEQKKAEQETLSLSEKAAKIASIDAIDSFAKLREYLKQVIK